MTDKGSALIVGAGSGLGAALGRRFAEAGHAVALAARSAGTPQSTVEEIASAGGKAKAYAVDATDETGVAALFDDAEGDLGPLDVVIHNVGGRQLNGILDATVEEVEGYWRNICLGGFVVGREAARRMVPRGAGTILFSGGRASRRADATFISFGIAKFGVRALAQAMARELAPQGVHVAHMALEGTLDTPRLRNAMGESEDADGRIDLAAAAEMFHAVHAQPRSAWSFEVDLRPYGESF